jgi:hypothetical protein
VGGCEHAHRDAHQHPDHDGDGGQLQRSWEIGQDVVEHRSRGEHRVAEVAAEHLADVDRELPPERQVEPQLLLDPLVDLGRRAVADGRQHRVDRDHAADDEGDQQQAEEGEGYGSREAASPAEEG